MGQTLHVRNPRSPSEATLTYEILWADHSLGSGLIKF